MSNKIMLNIEDLNNIENYDSFSVLSRKLSAYPESELFDFLFPISIDKRENNSGVAGKLLIDLDPKHTRSCAKLIDEVANSNWFVSFQEVPFYLVTQFGKWNLKKEIDQYISNPSTTKDQRQMVKSVWYWASMPTSGLCEYLHYFEWQVAIERDNSGHLKDQE
jgi:hypothetical protein